MSRMDLEFNVVDFVYLRISPMKSVYRFGKKWKLIPRYVGPYKILSRYGKVAYKLEFLAELGSVYLVFLVSLVKKWIGDPTSIVPLEKVGMENSLSYEEIPVNILDLNIHRLRNKEFALVKVLWRNQTIEGATWDAKTDMRAKYPYILFTNPVSAWGKSFLNSLINSFISISIHQAKSSCHSIHSWV